MPKKKVDRTFDSGFGYSTPAKEGSGFLRKKKAFVSKPKPKPKPKTKKKGNKK